MAPGIAGYVTGQAFMVTINAVTALEQEDVQNVVAPVFLIQKVGIFTSDPSTIEAAHTQRRALILSRGARASQVQHLLVPKGYA